MAQKLASTFKQEMQNDAFRKAFDHDYQEFLLSELLIAMMADNEHNARALAESIGVSPTVVQNIRSGKQQDVKLRNFINMANACGYDVLLRNSEHQIKL